MVSNSKSLIYIDVTNILSAGATLQMGIGSIPDAVLSELKGHKRLGIHTEMFSDGVIDLVERGVITNEEKKVSSRSAYWI
jgi:acyl-CoA hydrolase